MLDCVLSGSQESPGPSGTGRASQSGREWQDEDKVEVHMLLWQRTGRDPPPPAAVAPKLLGDYLNAASPDRSQQ